MFENPDYQVDERSEEFRLLNPIVSQVGEKRRKKLSQLVQQEEQVQFSPSWTEKVWNINSVQGIVPKLESPVSWQLY